MKFKGTTALFAIFVILGGYIYFSEFRGKDQREKQEEAKKKAFNVEPADIVELSLVSPDHTLKGVRKGDKQWVLAEPSGIEADSDEWEQLASDFSRIEREGTISAQAEDLAPFGLKDPAVKVIAKTKDGKSLEISFGGENPRKVDNYAKLGNSEVFLTPSSWANMFKKTLSDVRDKKILDFETDDVDAVTIVNGTTEIVANKSGDSDWTIQKPIVTKADASEISSFISTIKFARASSFAEPSIDAKAAGLAPPAIKITLHDAKAKTDRILLIGKSPETDKYYAMDGSRPTIFIIDKEIEEKAKRPLFDWRDKSIAQIDPEKIDGVEIQHGSDKLSFKKTDTDWKLPDGRKLQFDKVSAMLNTLAFDKAKDIIEAPGPLAKYGLDKPRTEVVFKQGTTELLRLSFGGDSKTPEGVYLKGSNSPAIKVIAKDVYDRFNAKAEDLVEPKPAGK